MRPSHDECKLRTSDHGFTVVALIHLDSSDCVISALELLEQVTPFCRAFGRSLYPLLEFLLKFRLLFHYIKSCEAFLLTAEALLHVAEAEEIVGIFEADLRILVHP